MSMHAARTCLGLLILPGAAALGQTPAAPSERPSIGVTTRVVRVEVVAEDEDGQPVGDLTRDELVLTDGGHREDIVSFSPHAEPREAAIAVDVLPANTFTNRPEKVREGPESVTAILFDALNTPVADQEFARQQVIRFLRQVSPGSWVSLYTLGRGPRILVDFTTDTEPLVRALERHRGELRGETEESPLPTLDAGLERFDAWLEELSLNLVQHYEKDRALRTIRSLEAIANHLVRIPGRKSLIWVSGSFPVRWITRDSVPVPGIPASSEQSFRPDIERAARALANANLAVYPVDARGLRSTGEYAPGRASISRQARFTDRSGFETMDALARRTGGRAFVNNNDLGRAFRRAVEDSRAAYTLVYEPSHDEWTGEFRRIQVKTTRPGVRLRHREGYFAQPEAPAEDWYRQDALDAAMWSPLDATRLGFTVRATPSPDNRLTLSLRLHVPDVSLRPVGDRWRGQLDLRLIQLGPGDELLDTVSHVADLSLTPADHRRLMRTNEILLVERLTLEESAASLRIVVRDVFGEALGSVTIPLDQIERKSSS